MEAKEEERVRGNLSFCSSSYTISFLFFGPFSGGRKRVPAHFRMVYTIGKGASPKVQTQRKMRLSLRMSCVEI